MKQSDFYAKAKAYADSKDDGLATVIATFTGLLAITEGITWKEAEERVVAEVKRHLTQILAKRLKKEGE
jgi:hypothetical protein